MTARIIPTCEGVTFICNQHGDSTSANTVGLHYTQADKATPELKAKYGIAD